MSVKEIVLLAIYNEYQKDLPNMDANITCEKLQLNLDEFNMALEKLENESLIKDLRASRGSGNKIIMAFLDNVKPSNTGIQYVVQKLLIIDEYEKLCYEAIEKEKNILETVKYCKEHNITGVPVDDVEAHSLATIEIYRRLLEK